MKFVYILLGLSVLIFCESRVEAKRKVFVPGRRGIVIDERLSALRVQPDLKASLEQRLRRGRRVGILGAVRKKDGTTFLRIAISRNTRGWILADAVARPGSAADANRVINLMEEASDDFIRVRLARLFLEEFREPRFAPGVLLILGQTAERVAERLSRDARRRIGDEGDNGKLGRAYYFLNFAGLDRYNRINVKFDYDEDSDRLVYDGAAYRELIRRYPRSAEAIMLKERKKLSSSEQIKRFLSPSPHALVSSACCIYFRSSSSIHTSRSVVYAQTPLPSHPVFERLLRPTGPADFRAYRMAQL